MTEPPERPDPRLRPPDPAGTRPKVHPDSLLPARRRQVQADAEPIVDAQVVEEQAPGPPALLPERAQEGARPVPEGALATAVAPVGPTALGPALETPHAPRFQFLLGALIAVGVAAIAACAALLVGRPSSLPTVGWSPWHPTSSGGSPAQQIAGHVGPEYRLAGGQQLVAVTGGPLSVAGLPITVVLRSDPSANGGISMVSGKGVLYRLCGLGPKCAIDQGKASPERHLLLRREALELALYSFSYLDGVDQVVVFLPPRAGQDPSQALFFRPGDLAPELEHPLHATLTGPPPSLSAIARSPDTSLVQRLTTTTLYNFSLTQGNQDANVFLVLRPFAVTGTATTP